MENIRTVNRTNFVLHENRSLNSVHFNGETQEFRINVYDYGDDQEVKVSLKSIDHPKKFTDFILDFAVHYSAESLRDFVRLYKLVINDA